MQMTYRVVVTGNAKENLREYYLHAAEKAPLQAALWLNRFEEALASLAANPERCAVAPEDAFVDPQIRQLLFGKRPSVFRALFTIVGDEVQILHVRRAAMNAARPDELFRQ